MRSRSARRVMPHATSIRDTVRASLLMAPTCRQPARAGHFVPGLHHDAACPENATQRASSQIVQLVVVYVPAEVVQ